MVLLRFIFVWPGAVAGLVLFRSSCDNRPALFLLSPSKIKGVCCSAVSVVPLLALAWRVSFFVTFRVELKPWFDVLALPLVNVGKVWLVKLDVLQV